MRFRISKKQGSGQALRDYLEQAELGRPTLKVSSSNPWAGVSAEMKGGG